MSSQKPSQSADGNPKFTKLDEVNFDYLPDSPLDNGWLWGYRRPRDGWVKFSLATNPPQTGCLSVESTCEYSIDCAISKRIGEVCDTLQVAIKFKGEKDSMFWTRVKLANKSGSRWEAFWIKHYKGTKTSGDAPETPGEWIRWMSGKELAHGWTSFIISLPEAVEETWGKEGWVFKELIGIRIRGNISISPIKILQSPPEAEVASVSANSSGESSKTETKEAQDGDASFQAKGGVEAKGTAEGEHEELGKSFDRRDRTREEEKKIELGTGPVVDRFLNFKWKWSNRGVSNSVRTRSKVWTKRRTWYFSISVVVLFTVGALYKTGALTEHSELVLSTVDGNKLENQEVVAEVTNTVELPSGALITTVKLENTGNKSTGKMTAELYGNEPLEFADSSTSERSYKYVQNYPPDRLDPNELASHQSIAFHLESYGIPEPGRYRCLLRVLPENGKLVQAEFWLVVPKKAPADIFDRLFRVNSRIADWQSSGIALLPGQWAIIKTFPPNDTNRWWIFGRNSPRGSAGAGGYGTPAGPNYKLPGASEGCLLMQTGDNKITAWSQAVGTNIINVPGSISFMVNDDMTHQGGRFVGFEDNDGSISVEIDVSNARPNF